MLLQSSDYWTALAAASADWRFGVDVLASDEATPLEDATYDLNATDRMLPGSASITLDTTAEILRSFTFALRSNDYRYLPGAKGYPSGGRTSPTATGLVWLNVRYRPWIDLRTGWTATGSKVYTRVYMGIFVLSEPEVDVTSSQAVIKLTLLDKTCLLRKPFQIRASQLPTFTKRGGHSVSGYAKGASFDTVMKDLATKAGIPARQQLFEASSLTLPQDYSITEGSTWWEHLANLAGSMAHVIYFDNAGNLVRRSHPLLLNGASAYTFTPGPTCIASEVNRKINFNDTYNHVIVIGAASKHGTVRGEAQIVNKASPYHKDQIGDRIVYVGKDGKLDDMTPDPRIGTTNQANTRAAQALAQHVGQQEELTIKGRLIPPLEPYDRITATIPSAGVDYDFLAEKVVWNLSTEATQELSAHRWFTIGE
jgi:hypothetical protein